MKTLLRSLLSRFSSHFRRRRLEAEMAEEMQAHLEVLTEEYVAAGLSAAEARLAARKRFGGVAQLQERCRDEQRFVWLEQVGKDVGFAVRSLARARGFTISVLAMLVLGIGIGTFVFDLTAWNVFFAPPYPHPEELVQLGGKDRRGVVVPYRPGIAFQAVKEQVEAFSEIAAVTRDVANVVIDGEPVAATVIGVMPGSFRTLGIAPRLGRGFLPEEHRVGGGSVVVISDAFRRRHFGAAAEVSGRRLLVNQQPCTVIGVLQAWQSFPVAFEGDIFRPMELALDPQNPLAPVVFAVARLKPGVTREQAQAVLAGVRLPAMPVWAASYAAEQEPVLLGLTELSRPEIGWVLAGAGALLYAIACLNVINLTLVRLLGRRRELNIRLALGGSRGRIVRLLAIESAALALGASAIVLAAVRWFFPWLLSLMAGLERVRHISMWNAATVTCVVVLTALATFVGTALALRRLLKMEIGAALKDGGPAAGEGLQVGRIRAALVVLQAAFAVVLLAGTGLMVRSIEKLHRVDLGFDAEGRVKVMLMLPRGFAPAPEVRLQLFERLQERLAALPGVRGAGIGQDSLLIGGFFGTAQLLMPDGRHLAVAGNFVGADFLRTAGLRLKRGRWLSGRRGEYEAVINEAFAKARFGDEDPVGRPFRLQVSGDYEIHVVGVVADIREAVRSAAGPRFYVPYWAYPANLSTVVLRLDADPPPEFAGLVRKAVYEVEPRLIVSEVSTMHQILDNQTGAERYTLRVLRVLTPVALVLAVVGLFSVVAYTVDVRMREFGVRLALGARPANLHRLVMRRGLATAGAGVVVGVAGALALTRFMQSLLFETTPYDPLVYAAVAAVLLVAAAAACWLPARRAARVDITKLLRTE